MDNTSANPSAMTTPNPNTTIANLFLNTTTSQVQPEPIDPPLRTCNYFVINSNKTVVFDFNNHYGGKWFCFW